MTVAITRRAIFVVVLAGLAFVAITGVAGAQEAADNVSAENSAKVLAAGLAMVLGSFGPALGIEPASVDERGFWPALPGH